MQPTKKIIIQVSLGSYIQNFSKNTNHIQEHVKKITHHDQLGVIQEM